MKRLYARIVLSLITPAFEEKARRELERWKADEPNRRAALEVIDRQLANSFADSIEGAGWRLSRDGKWERRVDSAESTS